MDPADIVTVLTTVRAAGLSGPVEIAAPADASSADSRRPKPTTCGGPQGALGIQAYMGILFGRINEIPLVALALGLFIVIFWATGCGGSTAPPGSGSVVRSVPRQLREPGAGPRRSSLSWVASSRWRRALAAH